MTNTLNKLFTAITAILITIPLLYGQNYQAYKKESSLAKKNQMAYELTSYFVKTDLDSLQILIKDQLHYANKEVDRAGIICGWNALGNLLIRKEKEKEGIQYLNKVKNYYLELGDFLKVTECLNEIGNGYVFMNRNQEAIEWYIQSLEFANLIQEYARGAEINLAQAYIRLGEYEKATKHAEAHRDQHLKMANYRNVANAFAVLGQIEMERENNEAAIYNFEQCYHFALRDQDNVILGHAYTNIGIVHALNEDYEKSLDAFETGLLYRKKVKNNRLTSDSYLNIASLYQLEKKYDLAMNIANQGLEVAKKFKLLENQLEFLELKKEILSEHDIEQLPPVLTEIKKIKEKINVEKAQEYEFNEDMTAELKNSISLAQSGFRKPHYETIFITGGLIILALFGFVIYNQQKT